MKTNFLVNILFKSTQKEIEYLEKTIEILINTYDENFKKLDDDYNQTIEEYKKTGKYDELYDIEHDFTHGELLKYTYPEIFKNLNSFSSTLIESMIVKHISIIERHIVDLSFYIQKKENVLIPPNHNITGHFTDKLKAVEYISIVTKEKFRIQDIKEWKYIIHLRKIRHIFAHGKNSFELKNDLFNEISKIIPIKKVGLNFKSMKKVDKKEKCLCQIKPELKKLKKLNELSKNFLDNIEKKYFKLYNNN